MRYINRRFTYLLTYIPRLSPIPVLTGLNEEQLRRSRPAYYSYAYAVGYNNDSTSIRRPFDCHSTAVLFDSATTILRYGLPVLGCCTAAQIA